MKKANILVDINIRSEIAAVATMTLDRENPNNTGLFLDHFTVDPQINPIVNTLGVAASVLSAYEGQSAGRIAIILKENIALRLIGATAQKNNPNGDIQVALDRLMSPAWIQRDAQVFEPAFRALLEAWKAASATNEIVFVNARTIYRYKLEGNPADLVKLNTGDKLQLQNGTDGVLTTARENSFLNGEYTVRVVSTRNPQTGADTKEYYVDRMLTFVTEDGERKRVSVYDIINDFPADASASANETTVAAINAIKLRRENVKQFPSNLAKVARITKVIDQSEAAE